MNILIKIFLRKKIVSLFLVFIVLTSSYLLLLGIQYFLYTNITIKEIDNNYCTIGLLSGNKEISDISFDSKGNMILLTENGEKYYEGKELLDLAKKSKFYKENDSRLILSAYIEGSQGLSSGAVNPLDYSFRMDLCTYNFSVLAVECISVESLSMVSPYDNQLNENQYSAKFKLIDVVSRKKSYNLPPSEDIIELDKNYSLYTDEGKIPFEPGKKYLIRGFYKDYDVEEQINTEYNIDENGLTYIWKRQTEEPYGINGSPRKLCLNVNYLAPKRFSSKENSYFTDIIMPEFAIEVKTSNQEIFFLVPENISWPYFAEYSGNLNDFLNSKEGKVWKEEIIPTCQKNHSFAPIMLSNDINTIYGFHSGNNYIYDGRTISEDEYVNGAKVCIVSSDYAELNNYKVGDKISIEIHNSGYERTEAIRQGVFSGTAIKTFVYFPITDSTKIFEKMEFTIVGTYAGASLPLDEYSFYHNIIFIPKNSIDCNTLYFDTDDKLLNSIVIENGSIDEFEKYLNENGAGGYFNYFDQGYSAAIESISKIKNISTILIYLSSSIFLFSNWLFNFICYKAANQAILSFHCIGLNYKFILSYINKIKFIFGIIITILSQVIVGLTFNNLNNWITNKDISLNYSNLLLSGLISFSLYTFISILYKKYLLFFKFKK